jgi:23S rRNA (cytosine1962-C5)-methyltransferase
MAYHMKNLNLTAAPWPDYELIDSGLNRKLERYGKWLIIRPETQAIWEPARPDAWQKAQAEFAWVGGTGTWKKRKDIPESWELAWADARFTARLTSFKHTGVFPEQAANWMWLRARVKSLTKPNVLNLFGYTGIATIVAAQAGAAVTHVDASKQSNLWAKENAARSMVSGASNGDIRFLLDDAIKFVEREVRRGATYDGIMLDPPAFGRGPKGEVWHIEEHLPRLLAALAKIFSKKSGAFFLLNGYAAGYSPQSFLQAIESHFSLESITSGEFGELSIAESKSNRVIPAGIYVRFVR